MVNGATAKISASEWAMFSAYDGYISGKNLRLIKYKLIVETWRASEWNEADTDSIFIFNLEPNGKDVVLNAIHANLPDKYASISKRWYEYYRVPGNIILAESQPNFRKYNRVI